MTRYLVPKDVANDSLMSFLTQEPVTRIESTTKLEDRGE